MTDEALESLRRLFLASLAVLLVWLLAWPSAIQKLEEYRAARDLHAWLYLKDRVRELAEQPDIDIFGLSLDEPIAAVEEPAESRPGDDYFEPTPLVVESTWPYVKRYTFQLEPAHRKAICNSVRIFRIRSVTEDIPLNDYYAVFLKDGPSAVIAAGHPGFDAATPDMVAHRQLAGEASFNRPKHWNGIALYLSKYGFTGPAEQLTLTEVAIARMREEADPHSPSGGVQLFGLQLSIGLFFSAVGLFLAAIAFAMIGPLVRLRAATSKSRNLSWIFIVPRSDTLAGAVLEQTLFIVTIVWAASPLALLALQLTAHADLEGGVYWAFLSGAMGLVLSSIVFGAAAWELKKFRSSSRG